MTPGCLYDIYQCLDADEIGFFFLFCPFPLWSFGFSFSDVYELFPLSFVNFISRSCFIDIDNTPNVSSLFCYISFASRAHGVYPLENEFLYPRIDLY